MEINETILYELMQFVVGNRGSREGNPYGKPAVKEMLKEIARQRGFKNVDANYFDALDNWPTEARL